jgi:diguanylate cyclase (GGDEF)-like protein
MVTRYGGDEFVVLVPNATRDSLAEIVERVARRTEARNASDETPYRLSFSMGASLYDPVLDGSASRFLSRLDDEMYRDKTRRKGAGIAGVAAVLKDNGRIFDDASRPAKGSSGFA